MTMPGEAASAALWLSLPADWEPCEAGCGKRVWPLVSLEGQPWFLVEETSPPPGVWLVEHTVQRCRALRATT